jgi:hypothetical protein
MSYLVRKSGADVCYGSKRSSGRPAGMSPVVRQSQRHLRWPASPSLMAAAATVAPASPPSTRLTKAKASMCSSASSPGTPRCRASRSRRYSWSAGSADLNRSPSVRRDQPSSRPSGRAIIVTPKLDRMFRSALDALDVLGKMKAGGISLQMIDPGGDTTGDGVSKLVFTILSAVAEVERDRTRKRITGSLGDKKGLSYRVIAERMDAAGRGISHVGVRTHLQQERRDDDSLCPAKAPAAQP